MQYQTLRPLPGWVRTCGCVRSRYLDRLCIPALADLPKTEALLERIRWWEDYTGRNGGEMDNNPSPGNKRGGLTTILEKSLGAVAKGGTSNLTAVYDYAERIAERVLFLKGDVEMVPNAEVAKITDPQKMLEKAAKLVEEAAGHERTALELALEEEGARARRAALDALRQAIEAKRPAPSNPYATDEDGDALTFAILGPPARGALRPKLRQPFAHQVQRHTEGLCRFPGSLSRRN